MTTDQMIQELESKIIAVDCERERRNKALRSALRVLLDCCKVCPRDGLCATERCSVRYALKYKPLERAVRLSDKIIKAGHDGYIDENGSFRASKRGRAACGRVFVDNIRL